MADLHVDFLGKRLAGPVIAASGTFGFGPEYAGIEDLRVLGGISGKGLTLNGQPGNEGERLYETPSGLMNSIGLQNPGVQHFIDHELPAMRRCGTTVWANLGGHTIEENVEGVQMLCAAGVDFIELNISCPNVKQGGLAFGIRAADAGEVVSAVRKVCTVPLIVKLSPQAESIPEMCKAVEAAGADAISLCNTFQACAIDLEKRRPVFNNTFAGLSGPAVRRLKRHVQSYRRLSHRRPPGEHRQFAPVKAARQVVQFVEPSTHLYMLPFFACLLVTERTRQDFACHLGRHPDIHASGGVFTQAVHVVCDTGEELHHVDIRLLRLQAAFVQARHTAAQHPFALYQTHIFVDVAVVAHRLQHGA